MNFIFTFLIILALFNFSASAQEKSPEEKLKKLSFVLRGKAPSAVEYSDFTKQVIEVTEEKALDAKLNQYLNSSEFSLKFTNKIADLFRVEQLSFSSKDRFNYGEFTSGDLAPKGSYYRLMPSFHLAAREVLEKNQPWYELITKKNYYIMFKKFSDGSMPSDLVFFSLIKNQLVNYSYETEQELSSSLNEPNYGETNYTAIRLDFDKNDNRLAGILTTDHFLRRYPTTGVNNNRKRAAALFRTLLCKDMVASIPVPKDGVDENKKLALMGEGQYTEADLLNHTKNLKSHGQIPECMQCHKQLDPVGALFGASPLTLSPHISRGKLTYYNQKGEFVSKPANGIGELTELIVKEDDYYSCQVKHFWKWVHGENSLLSPKQEVELVQTFKSMNQKPKDFIKFIASQKEFYSPPKYTEAQLTAVGAFKTLKKCQSCHNQQNENFEIQDLDWYKLIGNKQDPNRQELVKQITSQLNQNKMPPKEAKKDFTESEMLRLNKWLDQGAPDFEGN